MEAISRRRNGLIGRDDDENRTSCRRRPRACRDQACEKASKIGDVLHVSTEAAGSRRTRSTCSSRPPFGVDGLDLPAISQRARHPSVQVDLMTAYSEIETAIESIRRGASHYLTKPFLCVRARALHRQGAGDARLRGSARRGTRTARPQIFLTAHRVSTLSIHWVLKCPTDHAHSPRAFARARGGSGRSSSASG